MNGSKVPFSAKALVITKKIINAKAKQKPIAIRYPVPCLDFLEAIITPKITKIITVKG